MCDESGSQDDNLQLWSEHNTHTHTHAEGNQLGCDSRQIVFWETYINKLSTLYCFSGSTWIESSKWFLTSELSFLLCVHKTTIRFKKNNNSCRTQVAHLGAVSAVPSSSSPSFYVPPRESLVCTLERNREREPSGPFSMMYSPGKVQRRGICSTWCGVVIRQKQVQGRPLVIKRRCRMKHEILFKVFLEIVVD